MNYFFFRLVGPRPDFALTTTPDEQALMREHGAYWRGLLDSGTALVFGLVSHPESPFGICVVRADDIEQARALSADDPVTKSGRGFTWEIYPMRAITRDDA